MFLNPKVVIILIVHCVYLAATLSDHEAINAI